MSKSYPFRSIARLFEVDYCDVLSYADYISGLGSFTEASIWQRRAVRNLAQPVKQMIYQKLVELGSIRSTPL